MYKLLKDKINEFQCEIKLEGTSAKNAKVRLFLEAEGCEYSFKGNIEGDKCVVPMGKLKKFENLLESGKIRLEVVADDTLFVPYENTYELEQEKKVTVEVIQPHSTPKKPVVEVSVTQEIQKQEVKPEIKKVETKKDSLYEIKKYLSTQTSFDGTAKSFQTIIKNKTHKMFFNALCEENNLDRISVIKQLLK
jgi:hypothetical protein